MAGIGSLFAAMDAGLSGMFASRFQMGVLNNNIANANTPGYSRQRAELLNKNPLKSTLGSIGRGVKTGGIERITDQFLIRQKHKQSALLGTYASMDHTLRSIEEILGGVQHDRIGSAMNDFFDAWSNLATPGAPEGLKESVVATGSQLALQLREVSLQMLEVSEDLKMVVSEQVDEANVLLHQISEMNNRIVTGTGPGGPPNDLLDVRDQLVARLTELMQVDAIARGSGAVDIQIGGRTLVSGPAVNEIQVVSSLGKDGQPTIALRSVEGRGFAVEPQEGFLVGQMRAYNETLGQARAGMDRLAQRLIDDVNSIHRQGVTSQGGGLDFFTGTGAGDIDVNDLLVKSRGGDASLVATGSSGEDGDRSLALLIAELADAEDPATGYSLNDQYSRFIIGVATERSSYETLLGGQESILNGLENRLESVRGVDVDEEMANMIRYQRAYEASARVISVVDEMLDTLINGMI